MSQNTGADDNSQLNASAVPLAVSQRIAASFKREANLGVGFGILVILIGNGLAGGQHKNLLAGLAFAFIGWALLIGGSVSYARWKGYSGWLGLFGYLLILGLLILGCLPNRRRRQLRDPEKLSPVVALDQQSGRRFLLTLAPLLALAVVVAAGLYMRLASIGSGEWRTVEDARLGFTSLMPGAPKTSEQVQESPLGKVEIHKFLVTPRGKDELFVIVVVRFPEEAGVALGGAEELLNIGRQDLLEGCRGTIAHESRIEQDGVIGLEMAAQPPAGALRARVYVTDRHIYEVAVQCSKARAESEDVRSFLDSFEVGP